MLPTPLAEIDHVLVRSRGNSTPRFAGLQVAEAAEDSTNHGGNIMWRSVLGISCAAVFCVACHSSNKISGDDDANNPDGSAAGSGSDVAAIPGIALWLDAAKGVTATNGKITAWADQTANHNDATQQNVNWQPSVVAAGIAGLPSVHFTATNPGSGNQGTNGTMLNIADSATLQWGSEDYLIEVVTRYDNMPTVTSATDRATGYGTFYSKQTQNPQLPAEGVAFFGNTPASDMAGGTTAFSSYVYVASGVTNAATGFNDGTARLLGTQRTGTTTLALRVNGAETATKTVQTMNVDEVGTGARIGASGDATIARLDGEIAEIIAVKGAISATDLATIESYLAAKYGL
jgi:hypothetical protein